MYTVNDYGTYFWVKFRYKYNFKYYLKIQLSNFFAK